MNTLLIGSISGYKSVDVVELWADTAGKHFSGTKVAVVSDVSVEIINKLVSCGFEIYHGTSTPENVMSVRFYDIANALEKYEFEYALVTDVRDVFFQNDPSPAMIEFSKEFDIVAAQEGFLYKDEPWSANNMKQVFGEIIFDVEMQSWEICCAGTIAGNKTSLINLFREIYLQSQEHPPRIAGGGGPDQAIYNVYLKRNMEHLRIGFRTNDDTFSVQLGTTLPAILAGSGDIGYLYKISYFPNNYLMKIGEAIRAKAPEFRGGVVTNYLGEPYSIVHQYDRVPEWNDHIKGIDKYVVVADIPPDIKIERSYIRSDTYKREDDPE